MRLYGFSHSSSTWRVRVALAMKRMQVDVVTVNVRRGIDQQNAAPFGDLNPARQIPVLEWEHEGGRRALGQSMAIIGYLEALQPAPPLWPRDPFQSAHAMQLAELVNAGIQPLQNNRVMGRLDELAVDSKAWARECIERGLVALEATASSGGGGRFLVGDEPTVADLFSVPQLYNARRFDVPVDSFPTLARCEFECLQLEAFSSTHPDAED